MSAHRQRGFTLIEMVVAFVILSISLTALYQSFANSLTRSARDQHLQKAALIADSLLARAGTEWALQAGQRRGHESGYDYELLEEPYPPRDPAAQEREPPYTLAMMKITATVSWPGSSGARSYSVSTLKWSTLQP